MGGGPAEGHPAPPRERPAGGQAGGFYDPIPIIAALGFLTASARWLVPLNPYGVPTLHMIAYLPAYVAQEPAVTSPPPSACRRLQRTPLSAIHVAFRANETQHVPELLTDEAGCYTSYGVWGVSNVVFPPLSTKGCSNSDCSSKISAFTQTTRYVHTARSVYPCEGLKKIGQGGVCGADQCAAQLERALQGDPEGGVAAGVGRVQVGGAA